MPVATPEVKPQSILRGTAIVSSYTLLSRLLGFVRDLLVARLLGAGMFADAFFVAYRIPNLLRSFVAEGAMTTAFVPVLAHELRKSPQDAQRAVRLVSGFVLIVTSILAILGVLFAPQITHLFAPGFSTLPEKAALCSELTAIMFPFVICISFVALLNSALNAVGIYGTAALSQVIMNVVLILGAAAALLTEAGAATRILAWSVVIAGVVQVVVQLPRLRQLGFSIAPLFALRSPVIREVVTLLLPAIVGASIYQLSIFLMTLLASLLPTGSVSWLYFADRLIQLPIGVFSIALASVLLPSLSRSAAAENRAAFDSELSMSLRVTTFVTFPIAGLFLFYASPIVELIFERGAFDPFSTQMTVLAIQGMALGIWTSSCHTMLTRACIAQRDPRTPTVISALSLIVLILVALLTMGPPRPDTEGAFATLVRSWQLTLLDFLPGAFLGHAGLAIASTVSSGFALTILALVTLRRRGRTAFARCTGACLRVLIATAATIALLSFVMPLATSSFLKVGLLCLAPPIYLTLTIGLRMPEALRCVELFQRALRRASK